MNGQSAWNRAQEAMRTGNHALAETILVSLRDQPGWQVFAHLQLSLLAGKRGDIRAASQYALSSTLIHDVDAELLTMQAKRLLQVGEFEVALEVTGRLIGHPGAKPDELAELGKLFSDHMLPEFALSVLEEALRRGFPQTPVFRYLLGLNRWYLGDARGEADIEACIVGLPEFAAAHWAREKLGGEGAERRVDRIRKLMDIQSRAGLDGALMQFAMARELDAVSRYDEAWDALQSGMRDRRQQVHYDEDKQQQLFRRACDAFDLLSHATVDSSAAGPVPIFIVGLPRTGTTLIEQWLVKRFMAASAGELRDMVLQMRWVANCAGGPHPDARLLASIRPSDLPLLGQRYLDKTAWRARGEGAFIDKWPENYLLLPWILAALPHARALVVRREPMDACFSNLREWFAGSYFYSYDQGECARQVARYGHFVDALESLRHPRILSVSYEAVVGDPYLLDAAAERFGLQRRMTSLDAQPASAVATASAGQVRSGVNSKHIGQWRSYASHLNVAAAVLNSHSA